MFIEFVRLLGKLQNFMAYRNEYTVNSNGNNKSNIFIKIYNSNTVQALSCSRVGMS